MKSTLLALLLALAPACASLPVGTDSVVGTAPEVAGQAAWLIAQLDLDRPVYVAEADLREHGLFGLSQDRGDHYLILLDRRLGPDEKGMVLVHELAHVLLMSRGQDDGTHGAAWGEAYAEVFRVWVRESP